MHTQHDHLTSNTGMKNTLNKELSSLQFIKYYECQGQGGNHNGQREMEMREQF